MVKRAGGVTIIKEIALAGIVILLLGGANSWCDENSLSTLLCAQMRKSLFEGVIHKVEASGQEMDFSRIEPYLPRDDTVFSIFYLRLTSAPRQEFLYVPIRMPAASMIKVFILGAAMEKVQTGALNLQDAVILCDEDKVGGAGILIEYAAGTEFSIEELLTLMITESDNTATNILIDRLGMEEINQYITHAGYEDTILQRKMMDFDAAEQGRENYTSVRDLGRFFTNLYDQKCVAPVYDAKMIKILKGQSDTEGIPRGVPEAVVAHKTGELLHIYHDGGIIYGVQDSVLVIMTAHYHSREETIEAVNQIASVLVHEE